MNPLPVAKSRIGLPGWGRRVFSLVAVALLAAPLWACGGGGAGKTPADAPVVIGEARGRVALGALAGATVEIYRAGNYAVPMITTTTSDGTSVGEIGKFSFRLEDFPEDTMFLLVAHGGWMHDVDDDGTLDGPTVNLGTVHALASAREIAAQEVVLSAVTDVVYHRVRYALQALYDDAYVARSADAWASFVLRTNLAGGPAIDNDDALAYDGPVHANATFRPHAHFADYVGEVALGVETDRHAFLLSREELAYWDLPDHILDMDVVGSLAYTACGPSGLQIWDVSDPAHVVPVGAYDTPGFAERLQVVGTRAYVGDGDRGLEIFDVTDPTTPALLSWIRPSEWVSQVFAVGDRVYVTNGEEETQWLHIVDATDPTAPTLLGSYAADKGVLGVRVEDGFAYLVEDGQIEVVDVSDPIHPVRQALVPVEGWGRIDVALGHLFFVSGQNLDVFTLASPGVSPQRVAQRTFPGYSSAVRVRGTRALVGTSLGIEVVDVSDPASPTYLGVIPTSEAVQDVKQSGALYVAVSVNFGFTLVGAGTPAPSGLVASLPLPSGADAIDASQGRLYVATANPAELVVYDTADPLAPTVLGHTGLQSRNSSEIAVVGSSVFAAEDWGLGLYDVTNPTNPQDVELQGDLPMLHNLATGPGVAYTTDGGRLAVYDLPTPDHLRLLSTIPFLGETRASHSTRARSSSRRARRGFSPSTSPRRRPPT